MNSQVAACEIKASLISYSIRRTPSSLPKIERRPSNSWLWSKLARERTTPTRTLPRYKEMIEQPIQWSLYYKTTHSASKRSYIEGGLKIDP